MALPIQYRKSGDTQLNFNFTEFATGKGNVVFYPIVSSGALYLSTTTAYNWAGDTSVTSTSTNGHIRASGAANADLDFDTTFERPINVQGKAIVTFNSLIRRISGGTAGTTSVFTIYLRKVSGGVETDLATGTHTISESLANNTSRGQECAYTLEIAKTHFKIGDTLRLTLQCTNNDSAWDAWILVDSENRAITIGDYVASFSDCRLILPVLADV